MKKQQKKKAHLKSLFRLHFLKQTNKNWKLIDIELYLHASIDSLIRVLGKWSRNNNKLRVRKRICVVTKIFIIFIYPFFVCYCKKNLNYCFRLPRARSSRTWCQKIAPTLFQHDSLAFRYFINAANRFLLFLVGAEWVQLRSCSMCSYRAN